MITLDEYEAVQHVKHKRVQRNKHSSAKKLSENPQILNTVPSLLLSTLLSLNHMPKLWIHVKRICGSLPLRVTY